MELDVKRFLSPADGTVALLARALVLASDLKREKEGIAAGVADPAANFGTAYYFLRGQVRSLHSVISLFDQVMADANFKVWLELNSPAREQFLEQKKGLDRRRSLIEAARNAIGGHAEESLGQAAIALAGEISNVDLGKPPDEDGLLDSVASLLMCATFVESWRKDKRGAPTGYLATITAYAAEAKEAARYAVNGIYVLTRVYSEHRSDAALALKDALEKLNIEEAKAPSEETD